MTRTFESRIKNGFAGIAVILALVVILAIANSHQFREASNDAGRSQETLRQLERIISTMVDAETGMRGYVISGEDRYLEPYNNALATIGGQMAHLKELLDETHIVNGHFNQLRMAVSQQIGFRRSVVERIKAASGDEQLRRSIRIDEGKQGMDDIRRLVADLEKSQEQALAVRKRKSERMDFQATAALVVLVGCVIGMLIAGRKLLRHYLEERAKNEKRITELAEESKHRAAELEALNKELEAFSYSVSHDLRAPLRHIAGFSDMLQSHVDGSLDEKGKRYLNTIAESAKRMGHLIDDLLVFSRMGRAEMRRERVSLEKLFDETIEELGPDIGNRKVNWKRSPLPEVRGDRSLLKQVVVNLLSNALKYSGTREVSEIELGTRDEADEHVIFVRDNGVGFDMAYANKLFGVFQRLHDGTQFEGTGIGLANVRRIVTRHGGRVWAEAELDKGATFYFSLPKATIHAAT
jgi:signal transduction histidine kinase